MRFTAATAAVADATAAATVGVTATASAAAAFAAAADAVAAAVRSCSFPGESRPLQRLWRRKAFCLLFSLLLLLLFLLLPLLPPFTPREINHALETVPTATLSSTSLAPPATRGAQIAKQWLHKTPLFTARRSLPFHHTVGRRRRRRRRRLCREKSSRSSGEIPEGRDEVAPMPCEVSGAARRHHSRGF